MDGVGKWITLLGRTKYPVVEQIGCRDRRLAIVELGAGDLGVGIDEGLLVDAPNSLQIADIERILGAAIARMLAFELAMRLLLGLGFFQRDDLRLGQHQAFLGTFGFQRPEPFVHGFEIVASRAQRTPAGETVSPRFVSSLAIRT